MRRTEFVTRVFVDENDFNNSGNNNNNTGQHSRQNNTKASPIVNQHVQHTSMEERGEL